VPQTLTSKYARRNYFREQLLLIAQQFQSAAVPCCSLNFLKFSLRRGTVALLWVALATCLDLCSFAVSSRTRELLEGYLPAI